MGVRKNSETAVTSLLQLADIEVNGSRPWDITVHDKRFYKRVLAKTTLGLGESYMDGWWDVPRLDQFFDHALRARLDEKVRGDWRVILASVQAHLTNMQSVKRAFQVGEEHYDLGNDLYESMLDKRMVYSCGYWKKAKTLDEAQEAKLELICQKLGLKRGMKLLDIGCGWGSLLQYAAEHYGVEGVGLTVSKEQAKLAREKVRGLPVRIVLQDYRQIKGKYDRIASVGMFEHVGYKNYRVFMKVVGACLEPGGLLLLHTIAENVTNTRVDPWVHKYIFPNGMLPSISQIGQVSEGLLVLEDWQNFGPDYERTAMTWCNNFKKAWPKLQSRYDERFYRMWIYYLLSFVGAFRSRNLQLWQIVFSKQRDSRYDSPR
ncbi:cyclopropane fatty acyl phospholipid synthase [Candidatus Saccharibacteria bacterium]|nr:cyclopropane fatty acyl phospholipid synthase [Candidatus Saccharibacteria bacterium]